MSFFLFFSAGGLAMIHTQDMIDTQETTEFDGFAK